MSAEFLIKMRDGAQMIADACNEQLEKQDPQQARSGSHDFNSLKWTQQAGGEKGPYFQTTKEANGNSPTFQALQKILEKNKGFCHLAGFKYWNHSSNPDIIDRRAK